MKKIISKLLGLVLVVSLLLSGCGSTGDSKSTEKAEESKTKIVASFYPMYIALLNITDGIDNVEVSNMTGPQTGCLHDYAITTENMKTLEDANIFVINGAGMESFMEKVTSEIPKLKVVEASEGIELIEGDGDEGDNPHVWVSISENIKQVENIGKKLEEIDSKNADKYKENTKKYVDKLKAESEKMHKELDKLPNRDIITFHEAFPYFAKEFNLNIVGVIEREPGTEPDAEELKDTIEKVKELKVKVLFAEPQYPAKAAESIAKETDAKVYTLDPAVTGDDNKDAYIKIMDKNLDVLKEALK
ncbi:MAG: metal ABC transporter substrate-binding protein [Clostridiaceae bacterium]|nr:metal ABC transporter substrate-binding protein [Clostridiaceae bacterium]